MEETSEAKGAEAYKSARLRRKGPRREVPVVRGLRMSVAMEVGQIRIHPVEEDRDITRRRRCRRGVGAIGVPGMGLSALACGCLH